MKLGVVFCGHGFTYDLYLVVFKEFDHGFGCHAIRFFRYGTATIHFVYDRGRGHAGTEAGDIGFLLVVFERFFDSLFIVGLCDVYFDEQRLVAEIFFYDIHRCSMV